MRNRGEKQTSYVRLEGRRNPGGTDGVGRDSFFHRATQGQAPVPGGASRRGAGGEPTNILLMQHNPTVGGGLLAKAASVVNGAPQIKSRSKTDQKQIKSNRPRC